MKLALMFILKLIGNTQSHISLVSCEFKKLDDNPRNIIVTICGYIFPIIYLLAQKGPV